MKQVSKSVHLGDSFSHQPPGPNPLTDPVPRLSGPAQPPHNLSAFTSCCEASGTSHCVSKDSTGVKKQRDKKRKKEVL